MESNKKNISKIRNRTSTELLERKKNFLIIANLLNKLKIKYFLLGGVLLGARREKNFIKWDWDVEFGLFSNDLVNNFEKLKKEIEINGFRIINYNKTNYTPKIEFIKNEDRSTYYQLYGWKYNFINKSFTRKKFRIPEKFLLKLSKIKFLNKNFNCPNNVDDYLVYMYGNWKKPLRSKNKREYLTKSFFNSNADYFNLFYKFISFLKKPFA